MLGTETPNDRKELILQLVRAILTRFEDESPSSKELEAYIVGELEAMGADEYPANNLTTHHRERETFQPKSFLDPVSGGMLFTGLSTLLIWLQNERHHRGTNNNGRQNNDKDTEANLRFCRFRMANGQLCGKELETITCRPFVGGKEQYLEICTHSSTPHTVEAFQTSLEE